MPKVMKYILSDAVQPEEINSICYGKCKRIQVGVIIIGESSYQVCHDKRCKYSDSEMPLNEEYTMRKLKPEVK
jgi:hypothetical protein